MKKIIQTIFSLGLVVAVLAMAPLASANYAFNTSSNDCKTVGVGNRTTGQGINNSCWASSVDASAGDEFVVGIYFNNTGTSPAQDVGFRVTDIRNKSVSKNGTISVTGSILVNGSAVKTETVTIKLDSADSAKVVFESAALYRNSTGQNIPVSNGSNAFSSSGFTFGTVNPGTSNQGVFKMAFSLEETGDNSEDYPIVATNIISGLENETGTVTLNGYADSNDSSMSTYFKYRRDNGSWKTTPTKSHGNVGGIDVSYELEDLSDGDYEYQLCATNSEGTKCGKYNSSVNDPDFVRTFTIDGNGNNDDDDDDNNDSDRPEVVTESATSIDEDSATLRGDLEEDGNDTVSLWFEYGRDDDDLDDRVNAGSKSSTGSFSKKISGLREDTRYYFRACGENDEGTDCGSIRSFTTDRDGGRDDDDDDNDDDASRPTVSTLGTLSVGSSVVVIDGYFASNGCSTSTYFEYGRTQSLGSNTSSINRGNASGSMAQSISGLSSSTTYYFRAVASNCEGISYGSIRSFTTGSVTVVNPPVVITNSTGGGSGTFIKLMITNNRDAVRQGREIAYDISWENISGRDLSGLILEVNFPEQMTVTETERGDITRTGNSIVYKIGNLARREIGEMTIFTEVRTGLREGDPVVAQAIIAFENPTTQATENAIGYDADEYTLENGTGLGASLFGLGFLPTSLAGWLIILLIVILIVLLVRYFMRRGDNQVIVNQAPSQNPMPATPAQDYVVYRPTPKQ